MNAATVEDYSVGSDLSAVNDKDGDWCAPKIIENSYDDEVLIDAKDFLFSMSYGVAWSDVMPVLLAGKSVFAPLNWGNAAHVKRLFPEAVVIQVTADEADLRRRLGSRGVHDKDQLDERIGNALRFSGSSRFADLLIDNRDGTLAGNIQAVEDFIAATVA